MKLAALCSAATLLFSAAGAHAASNEYTPLMKAKKFAEAERLAATRLAADPNNAAALAARSMAIAGAGVQSRIPEAIKYAEQCVKVHAANAECHLTLGNMLGWKAMTGGMLSAMGYAGDIRDAFKKAVELDPRNLDARFSLLQFYMMAPAIAGGGSSKAAGLVTQTTALDPEAGKIMQAMLEADSGALAKAEAIAATVRAGTNEELLDRHESLYNTVTIKYLNDKKVADAERNAQAALRFYPASEFAAFAQARVRQEQGRHREAVTALEALLAKNPPRAYILYRVGQSQQALGDKARAIAAYEKALAIQPALNPKQKSDAQSQLASLKG